MHKLLELQEILVSQYNKADFYNRTIFTTFACDNSICGIVGARGVGKTTFLMHRIIQANKEKLTGLYVSADNIYFIDNKLIDLVDMLYKESAITLLCIDEIHTYPNWGQELKNIADSYPSIRIIFSGSSEIDLIKSKYDLSRRVTLYHLHGLSFREYLEFELKKKIPIQTFRSLREQHVEISRSLQIPKLLLHFKTYLKRGYYPFLKKFKQDSELFQVIQNATKKNIYEDIASFHTLKTSALSTMESLLKFTINRSAGELSVYKLANTLHKDFSTISNYIKWLYDAGLLRLIYPQKSGHSFLKNPAKIYPNNTNLIYAALLPLAPDQLKGKLRETFFVAMAQNSGLPIYYSNKGDFLLDSYPIEIGGKNKSRAQLKGEDRGILVKDECLIGHGKTIPLYLFGLLY